MKVSKRENINNLVPIFPGCNGHEGKRIRGILPETRTPNGHIREGLGEAVPDPGSVHSDRPLGQRHTGEGEERNGQDRRVQHTRAGTNRPEERSDPSVDNRADPRAGAANEPNMYRTSEAPRHPSDGDDGRHESPRRHYADLSESPGDNRDPRTHIGSHGQAGGEHEPLPHAGARRGGQAAVAGLQGHARSRHLAPPEGAADLAVLGDVPAHRQAVHGQALKRPVRDQSHGGADAEGRHAVLRVRSRTPESPLLEHIVFKGSYRDRRGGC